MSTWCRSSGSCTGNRPLFPHFFTQQFTRIADNLCMSLKYEDLFNDETVHMVSDPGNEQEQVLADLKKTPAEQTTEKEFLSDSFSTQSRQSKSTHDEDKNLKEFRQVANGRWDENKVVVKRYILDLYERNDDQARLLLEKAMKNGGRFTQTMVCKTLGRMGEWGLRTLIKYLVTEKGALHPEVHAEIKQMAPVVCHEILDFFEKPSEFDLSIRQKLLLMDILSDLAHQRVPALFCQLLKHPLPAIRAGALKGLRRQGEYAQTQILRFLNKLSPEHEAFEHLVILLTDQKCVKLIPLLQRLLATEDSPLVLVLVSWSLGELRATAASETLVDVLLDQHQSVAVQKSILEALRKIAVPEVVPSLVELLQHRELREEVIRTLGVLGGEQARLAVEPYLESDVAFVRCLAAQALVKMGHVESMRKVFDHLYDVDPFVQRFVLRVLEEVYTAEEIDSIYTFLEAEFAQAAAAEEESEDEEALVLDDGDFHDPEADADDFNEDYGVERQSRQPRVSLLDRVKQSASNAINTVKGQMMRQNPYANPFGKGGGANWDPWAELAKYNQNPGSNPKGGGTSGQFPW